MNSCPFLSRFHHSSPSDVHVPESMTITSKLSDKYLPNGQSGIVTFGVKGGYDSAKTVADKTEIFSLLANIGDSKSLIIHPASTTHQQLNDDQQVTTGVTKDLISLENGHRAHNQSLFLYQLSSIKLT